MSKRPHWSFIADPVQNVFRITAGDRIVGVVATEADAKLICDAINNLPPTD